MRKVVRKRCREGGEEKRGGEGTMQRQRASNSHPVEVFVLRVEELHHDIGYAVHTRHQSCCNPKRKLQEQDEGDRKDVSNKTPHQ